MTSTDTFFDNAYDHESRGGVRRDQYGRPLLVPAGAGPEGRQWYTSMSTLAKMVSDSTGLHKWEQRLLVRGLGGRPDLYGLASALSPQTGDTAFDRITNSEIDDIIHRALDAAGRDVKADWGTAVHGHTDPGADPARVPVVMRSDVEAYHHAMAGAKQVMSEVFVANDRLRSAGTFDGTYRFLGVGHVLADKKTGKFKPIECAIQLAGYRDAQPYDVMTDERYDWPDDLRDDIAYVIHIPYGEHRTLLYEIDLAVARSLADLAADIRDARMLERRDNVAKVVAEIDLRSVAQDRLAAMLEEAKDRLEVEKIHTAWSDLFDARHFEIVTRRFPGTP